MKGGGGALSYTPPITIDDGVIAIAKALEKDAYAYGYDERPGPPARSSPPRPWLPDRGLFASDTCFALTLSSSSTRSLCHVCRSAASTEVFTKFRSRRM
jgi:hypothetical protein